MNSKWLREKTMQLYTHKYENCGQVYKEALANTPCNPLLSLKKKTEGPVSKNKNNSDGNQLENMFFD